MHVSLKVEVIRITGLQQTGYLSKQKKAICQIELIAKMLYLPKNMIKRYIAKHGTSQRLKEILQGR